MGGVCCGWEDLPLGRGGVCCGWEDLPLGRGGVCCGWVILPFTRGGGRRPEGCRWQREVGVDFVADDEEAFALADVGDAEEGFLAPEGTGGVVGVAHDEDLAAFGLALEVVEVDVESIGSAGVPPAGNHSQRAAHHLAATAFRHVEERRVDGRGDQHAVAGGGQRQQGIADAGHDAGDEVEGVLGGVDVVMLGQPGGDGLPVALGGHGVAQHGVFEALAHGVQHEVGRRPVVVGHPHGEQVVAAVHAGQGVPLEAVGAAAFYLCVEVVLFHCV